MIDIDRRDLTLGIVGTGAMGRGIAQIAAQAGVAVRLLDSRASTAAQAKDELVRTFEMLAGKGRMTAEAARQSGDRLHVIGAMDELAGAHIVVEAIVEDLGPKQKLFAALEPIVGDDCLIASNTSSLSVTAIASSCKRPGRVGGFHFFNPVPLMKVVEVIDGVLTEPWVGEALTKLARRMGHQPVRATDTPGFIVNHAGRGFGTEALRILQEGVASFDTIDRILRESAGFRMGPFELMDLTGVDVSYPVMESIYDQFYQEPRFRPSYLLRQRYVAGLLGRKVGRGFYNYREGKQLAVPEPSVPQGKPMPVWIDAAEVGWRDALRGLVKSAGWTLEQGDRPGAQSLCLVAPLGDDATVAALARGLDARRTVAIDMLFGLAGRRSVMTTPVTDPECLAAACALLSADGAKVARLRDSSGFVAQRVVATIVNIGCDIAQQGIASPEDIDNAVQLGLGYPKGPLAFGDALGPARILQILESLSDATRDPRYRPSPWLMRRARLGVSLRTAEQ
jgi:3-hydroxybutyryl-CoA dehydrogenase